MTSSSKSSPGDDETPKKKKTMRSKKTTKTATEETFLKGVIQSYVDQYREKKKISQQEITTITSFIEEYLQAFIIVGYNHEGDIITHVSANNQVQADALNTCLGRYIMDKMQDKDSRGSEWPGDGRSY